MLCLPPLAAGSSPWRLPLSDHTAVGLTGALLAEDEHERRQRLKAVLRDDPALALWAAIVAERMSGAEPATIDDLDAWLTPRTLVGSHRMSDDCRASDHDEIATSRFWTDLVVRSVAVARRAEELAARSSLAPSAYLRGLLHAASEWLTPAQSADQPRHDSADGRLPFWLADLLESIDTPPEANSPAAYVRRARDELARHSTDASTGPTADEQAAAVGRRWNDTLPEAGENLLRLISKLTRLDELETEFQIVLEREKLAAMKQLAYGASHEINNPLANISTRAQTLLRDEKDPERRRKLATINSQAFRAHEMIANMMLFAHPPEICAKAFDIAELIDEVIAELKPAATLQGTKLVHQVADSAILVVADRVQLALALKALGDNALEALGGGGQIEFAARRAKPTRPLDEEVSEISVRDTGPGISPQIRRHLFDPFYSGREAGRGLGFGLSKCWRIVEQHGGDIRVNSSPGQGCEFVLRLPASYRKAEQRAA